MNMPAAQIQIIWGYLLQDIYPGTKLTSFHMSDATDLTKPLEIKLTYQIEKYPLEADKFLLVKSPVAMGAFEVISRLVFSTATLPERKYPYQLGFTFGATEEEVINLPPGYEVKAVPDAVQKKYGPIDFKMSYQSQPPVELREGGTQVSYQKQLLLRAKKMTPEEYSQFKDVLKTSSKSARGEIIMEKEEG